MGAFWWLFELFPSKQLSYKDPDSTTWYVFCTHNLIYCLIRYRRLPHRFQGRVIKPGQKIHTSVCFIRDYQPKALLNCKIENVSWGQILSKGRTDDLSWVKDAPEILELDLFDILEVDRLISGSVENIEESPDLFIGRLKFLSLTRKLLS